MWETGKVVSIGECTKPDASIVLLKGKRFENLRDFKERVLNLLANFKETGPHLFLLPESHFKTVFPRREIRATIRELAHALEEKHPGSSLVFSAHETRTTTQTMHLTNTGYVITRKRFFARPKLLLAQKDESAISNFSEHKPTMIQNWEQIENAWSRILFPAQEQTSQAAQRAQKYPFPSFKLGDKKVEARVCADAIWPGQKDSNLLVISAYGLPKYMRPTLQSSTSLGIINDLFLLCKPVLLFKENDETKSIKLTRWNTKKAKQVLAEHKTALHFVEI